MNKKVLAITASALLAFSIPALSLAESTGGAMRSEKMVAKPTSGPTTEQIACVANAVSTREASLGTGVTTLTQAMSAAYSARATALSQAYTKTTNSEIKTAVKAAWSTFSSSMKSARTAWQSTRSTAWTTFRTAVKACKAPTVTTDSANSVSEASGL